MPTSFDHEAEAVFTESFAFLGEREIRLAAAEFALQRKDPTVADRVFAEVSHSPDALSYAYGLCKSIVVHSEDLKQ